jgi:hypothetical protein
MTTADSGYDDIFDGPVEAVMQETLNRLSALSGAVSVQRLSPIDDRQIVRALRENARWLGAGADRPSTRVRPTRWSIPSWVGCHALPIRFVSAAVALSIAISSVLVFGDVASGPSTPVSAAAIVLGRAARFSVGEGRYAQFTYVVSFGGGRWGTAITGGNQIWVRGRSSLGPEVEAAYIGIPSIRDGSEDQFGGYGGWELVIGAAAYQGANDSLEYGFPGPLYAFYMSPANQLKTNPIEYVLSHGGAQTARFLEQSLGRSGAIATHRGTLDGHRVDVVTVTHWPGQRTGALALYFDRKTHLLRGLDGRGLGWFAPQRRWSIRLVHAQMTGARRAWNRNLHLMLSGLNLSRHFFYRDGRRVFSGWVPIEIQSTYVADLRNVCQGIRHVDADLWAGMGALAACRTVMPDMTASKLVSALTAWDRHELQIGIRERIFSPKVINASLAPVASGLLSDILRSPRAQKARVRDIRERFQKGQITRAEAMNELL